MLGDPDSCGIWAPCLTLRRRAFWLIYTDVKRYGRASAGVSGASLRDFHNYLVTCDTIDGEWSDPIPLNSSGFDPSLFHDDDGRKYLVNMLWDHRPNVHSLRRDRAAGVFRRRRRSSAAGEHLRRHVDRLYRGAASLQAERLVLPDHGRGRNVLGARRDDGALAEDHRAVRAAPGHIRADGTSGAATSGYGTPDPSAVRSQPSSRPDHFLDRGFSAECAAAAIAKRPAAKMDHVGLAVLRLHQVGVSRALQFDIRAVAGSQYVLVGMQFVRAGQFARARHRDRMAPACAALGCEQIVITVAFVEMRPFGKAQRCALEIVARGPNNVALGGSIPARQFRQIDCRRDRWSQSMLTKYLRPSSSWNSEGSKPLLLR